MNIKQGFEMKEKIKAYVTLIRPMGWGPFWFSLLFGLIDSGFSSLDLVYLSMLIYGPLLLGGIYVLNFYSDIEADKLSDVTKDVAMAKQPFVTGKVKPTEGLILAALLLGSGLFLSLMINLQVFLLSLFLVFIGIIYSFPPRLKDMPFGDIAANAISGGLICYAAGWCAFNDISNIPIYPILWLVSLIAAAYLLTVIIDIEADRRAGLRTTAVVLGVKNSIRLSFLTCIPSLIFYVLILLTQIKIAYLLILPLLIQSPLGFYKAYRKPSRIYRLAKLAIISSLISIIALLLFYSIISILGISDISIIKWLWQLLK